MAVPLIAFESSPIHLFGTRIKDAHINVATRDAVVSLRSFVFMAVAQVTGVLLSFRNGSLVSAQFVNRCFEFEFLSFLSYTT